MHIPWDDLQTLEALVRTGSVLAAARELSLRHSSVSRRIDALERSLGLPLFVRGARLHPTPLALSIARQAEEMRTQAQGIQALVESERRMSEGQLVITTNDVLAPLLFGAIADARLENERVEVLVSDAERELEPGVTDLALRPSYTPGGTLLGQRVGRLRLGVFRASETKVGGSAWVLPAPQLRERASIRWWKAIPQDAESQVSCDSLLSMREACAVGLGKCVLPIFLADGDGRLGLLEEIDGGPPVWLLSPATRRSDRGLRRTKAALLAALRGRSGTWI